MSCTVVATICLRIGERRPYGADLTKFCSKFYANEEVYELTEVVRPVPIEQGGGGATGFEYRVTTAGQSGASEPVWPTTNGETVTSGSVVFTTQPISNDSLSKTIDTSTWSSPTGVDIEGASTVTIDGEQKTAAYLKAVSAVRSAEVVNHVTFSDGHEEDFVFKVKVS